MAILMRTELMILRFEIEIIVAKLYLVITNHINNNWWYIIL